MREIKFRAWDAKHKKMHVPDGKLIVYDDFLAFPLSPQLILPDLKIMQFTGLKDKNGKEVYEGDIVRYADIWTVTQRVGAIESEMYDQPVDTAAAWRIEKVIFEDCAYRFEGKEWTLSDAAPNYDIERIADICRLKDKEEIWEDGCRYISGQLNIAPTSRDDFFKRINGIEVIGNVYENAELLK